MGALSSLSDLSQTRPLFKVLVKNHVAYEYGLFAKQLFSLPFIKK
jgi:hypothetical protein